MASISRSRLGTGLDDVQLVADKRPFHILGPFEGLLQRFAHLQSAQNILRPECCSCQANCIQCVMCNTILGLPPGRSHGLPLLSFGIQTGAIVLLHYHGQRHARVRI
jgi:hypothetical protein